MAYFDLKKILYYYIMATRRAKKPVTKKANTKKPENLEIVIRYRSGNGALSEDEQKKFIRNLKKQNYYYNYLSGKFKFAFENTEDCTIGTFLWKEGAGGQGESYDRVIALLLGDFNILPEGVTAKLVKLEDVYKKTL
jgi:hypothetical protein